MMYKEKSKKKSEEKSQVMTDMYTFSEVVENACEGLMDRQIKYNIRRIQQMEDCLNLLEQELDGFLDLQV